MIERNSVDWPFKLDLITEGTFHIFTRRAFWIRWHLLYEKPSWVLTGQWIWKPAKTDGSKRFWYQKRRPWRGCRVPLLLNIEIDRYGCCINCWQLDLPLSALEKSELSKTRFHNKRETPVYSNRRREKKGEGEHGGRVNQSLSRANTNPYQRVMDPAVREEPTDNI